MERARYLMVLVQKALDKEESHTGMLSAGVSGWVGWKCSSLGRVMFSVCGGESKGCLDITAEKSSAQ